MRSMKTRGPRTEEERERALLQGSLDKMKRRGFTLTDDAMKQAEFLINDGIPLSEQQADRLAGFLRLLSARAEGRHKG